MLPDNDCGCPEMMGKVPYTRKKETGKNQVDAKIEEYPTNDATRKQLRMEEHVQRMLTHLTPKSYAGIEETPERVARMWLTELTSGYAVDVPGLFRVFDSDGYEGMVIVKDIPVISTCEHHLLPIVGYAHVGYIPEGKVIGLSKLPRVVNAFARRLQIQERLTAQIHDSLTEYLTPNSIVMISAEHSCMSVRGVQAPGSRTVTSAVSGKFRDRNEQAREEFLELIR